MTTVFFPMTGKTTVIIIVHIKVPVKMTNQKATGSMKAGVTTEICLKDGRIRMRNGETLVNFLQAGRPTQITKL